MEHIIDPSIFDEIKQYKDVDDYKKKAGFIDSKKYSEYKGLNISKSKYKKIKEKIREQRRIIKLIRKRDIEEHWEKKYKEGKVFVPSFEPIIRD
jgi:hypothetical protein